MTPPNPSLELGCSLPDDSTFSDQWAAVALETWNFALKLSSGGSLGSTTSHSLNWDLYWPITSANTSREPGSLPDDSSLSDRWGSRFKKNETWNFDLL